MNKAHSDNAVCVGELDKLRAMMFGKWQQCVSNGLEASNDSKPIKFATF